MTPKDKFKENLKAILIALFAALVLRQFVIASYNVPTGSMKDTILIGDFMFVNKFVYGARTPTWIGIPFTDMGFSMPHFTFPAITKPKQSDIVVFEYPRDPHLDYIKRCVAVGGQTVKVRNGDLYVDGVPEGEKISLGRQYDPEEMNCGQYVERTQIVTPHDKTYEIRHCAYHNLEGPLENFGPREIPEDHYFMMGDNRDNSQDSRSWGFVPQELVVGKPLMTWLSWNSNNVPGYRFYDKIRWDRLGMVIR